VPIDYVVGPGDTLKCSYNGNEPATYTLTVGATGASIPETRPITVSGMSFDRARATIEQRVTSNSSVLASV